MVQRSKVSREAWERAISDLEARKRTRKDIAAEFGVAVQTVDYWRHKIMETRRSQRLVRVSVSRNEAPTAQHPVAELVYGDVALRFTDRMPAQYVAEVMRCLRGR